MSQAKLKVIENNNIMDKENRTKSLEAAVSLIEKNYGKGSIMKLGSKANVDIESISTGSLGLDIALGIGGVPKGRIVEILWARKFRENNASNSYCCGVSKKWW